MIRRFDDLSHHFQETELYNAKVKRHGEREEKVQIIRSDQAGDLEANQQNK